MIQVQELVRYVWTAPTYNSHLEILCTWRRARTNVHDFAVFIVNSLCDRDAFLSHATTGYEQVRSSMRMLPAHSDAIYLAGPPRTALEKALTINALGRVEMHLRACRASTCVIFPWMRPIRRGNRWTDPGSGCAGTTCS